MSELSIITIVKDKDLLLHWVDLYQLLKSTRDIVPFWRVRVMVFNATFNNISVISWRSVLLVEETELPRENHHPATSL